MEVWRSKNVDTRIVFPIPKTDGSFITAAAGLDSEYALIGAHGAAAPSFADCGHEAVEIGATGLYYLDVAAAEVNDDYGSVIQVKSSSTGAIVQVIIIHTTPYGTDVVSVSGDTAAADNLELAYDGTGYAGGTTKQQVAVASMTTDVVTADALAAGAVTEIQSGLSTLDAAAVRTALGLASANLDTQLAGLDTLIDTLDTNLDSLLVIAALLQKHAKNKLVRTDNGDGTITVVLYDDDNVTALLTWTYTTATATRAKAV